MIKSLWPGRMALIGGAALLLSAAAAGVDRLLPSRDPVPSPRRSTEHPDTVKTGTNLDSVGRVVLAGQPFRASRSPAASSYMVQTIPEGPVAPPEARPNVRLKGIVWGNPPAAVLENTPGAEAERVVSAGDSIGSFRVLAVGRMAVTLRGRDSTWTFQLRQPWQ